LDDDRRDQSAAKIITISPSQTASESSHPNHGRTALCVAMLLALNVSPAAQSCGCVEGLCCSRWGFCGYGP
jgi:hypothetical protein